jgi:hypothetical protein
MYPSTTFEIDDQSAITAVTSEAEIDRPVFMMGITSDKGPEAFQQVVGLTKFKSLYGDISFAKHGQPLLQAARVVDAGGKLYVKRIVADDSRLANIGVVAKVTKTQVQKTDNNGNELYLTTSGTETTDSTAGTPIIIQKATIGYELKTITATGNNLTTFSSAFYSANKHTGNEGDDDQYALFILTDVGRGVSKKKFRITPDYNGTKSSTYVKHLFEVLENNEVIESYQFTMTPDITVNSVNFSIENMTKSNSIQMRCKMFEDEVQAMIDNVAYIIGDESGVYASSDILFGCDNKGNSLDKVLLDTTVDLRNIYGTSLVGGDNGSFGTSPISAAEYSSEMVKVFNGTADEDIYNLDNIKLDFVVDANYPALVKRAIEGFVTFREDCYYFRDLGLGLYTIDEIQLADENSLKNRYCGSYHNSQA